LSTFVGIVLILKHARLILQDKNRKETIMALSSIIVWVIVGAIAGSLAEWLIGGISTGCIGTVLIGIVGAFIGAWLLSALHVSIGFGLINDIITATIGAAVLLLGIRIVRRA
jgi:uncharacterized membrane protein YeaQ/YmgE (transglycosylase-associated protein family)